ncbi:MAG: SDR family NAD(P)-dependent oxidoreductase [Thermomicrobiales bacterium]
MGAFEGQVAVVTGASAGVGRAVALALAHEEAAVGLVARGEAKLGAVEAEIRAAGGRALALTADVADEAAIGAAVDRVASEFGGLDIVIANAGAGGRGAAETLSLAAWQAVLATKSGLTVPDRARRCHTSSARGRGQIIAVSSGAGKHGYADGVPLRLKFGCTA